MSRRLLTVGILCVISSPVFAGTVSMSSTPYPDSVIVTVTITDTGGAPGCGWLTILRGGQETFYYIERQVGSTITRRFVDTDVQPNTLYCYEMDLRMFPGPIPCSTGSFCNVFECFYPPTTCVNTGPDPALLGRGRLSSRYPDGTPIDGNDAQALLYPCTSPETMWFGLHTIPPEAVQYVDTATEVEVRGTWVCCWAQGVWLLAAQVVTPKSCVLPVEKTTWGGVKALYSE